MIRPEKRFYLESKKSDFIILIIGERYGSIIPKMTLSKKLSITRWEYVKAVKSFGKHALVYFKKVESNDPIYYDSSQLDDYKIKRRYLADFKNELTNIHNPKYFTTVGELTEEVRRAIIPTYRAGVKSLVKKNESLKKEIETLKLENQKLRTPTPIKDNSQIGLLGGLTQPRAMGLLARDRINEGYNRSNSDARHGLLGQLTNRGARNKI